MIAAIGIDSTEIERFIGWAKYPKKKLIKLFSDHEVKYCLSNQKKSAERFASRFAAREAFFKAFSQMKPDHKIPFLKISKLIWVESKNNNAPILHVDWKTLVEKSNTSFGSDISCLISITHTNNFATAVAIIKCK